MTGFAICRFIELRYAPTFASSLMQWMSWIMIGLVFIGCADPGDAQNAVDPWTVFKQKQPDQPLDLCIRNATILDGTGGEVFEGDVVVSGDKIVFIGSVPDTGVTFNREIAANGLYLAPGFIDPHAHGNPLKEDAFVNFLAMGVTSVCLGQDGTSPMVDDMRTWFSDVEAVPQLINVIPMVGHGTLRVLSGIQYAKQPDPSKLQTMIKLLDDALDAGCFGLTTGLEYEPGGFADSLELKLLAQTVGNYHRLIMSHIRNEDDDALFNSIHELAAMGKFAPVQISHIKSVYGKGRDRGREILDELHAIRRSGIAISQDWYPYSASYTGLSILFPEWAKPPNDYQVVSSKRRNELRTYLHDKVLFRNGPEATLFGSGPYRGKTLAVAASHSGKSFEDVLIDLGPSGASAAYFIMDDTLQEMLLLDTMTMICSDGSPDMFHPRGYGTFVKILAEYVRDRHVLSLPEAIYKMTGLTARTLQIPDRGIIQTGNFADLVLFDLADLDTPADYQHPHELAHGIEWVLVNGKIAWQKQSIQFHAGRILRKDKS